MTVKPIAKRMLPSAVLDAARRLRSRREGRDLPEWEFVPDGWAAADHARGWDVSTVVAAEKRKWPEFLRLVDGAGPLGIAHEAPVLSTLDRSGHNIAMSFGYVLARAAHGRSRISVLDWGGGLGHYFVLGRALVPEVELDYHCRELRPMCEGGAALLPEVTFHHDDGCFDRRYDLVLASASLQSARDWKQVGSKLASATGRFLYITRLPIVESAPSFVVMQRTYAYGYGTEYLSWYLNRGELLGLLAEAGAHVEREFLGQEAPEIPGAPDRGDYRGFLFRTEQPQLEPRSVN